jgi:hypothetical protein
MMDWAAYFLGMATVLLAEFAGIAWVLWAIR